MLRNRKHRDIALQVIFLAVVAGIVIAGVLTTIHNLRAQNLSMGWDFLDYSTGSTISFSLLPHDISATFRRALFIGFLNTIFLGVTSIVLATIIGGIAGTARLAPNKLVNLIAAVYIQIFRNVPLILQALFWYTLVTHALPAVRGAFDLADVVFISNRGVYLPSLGIPVSAGCLAAGLIVAGLVAPSFVFRAQRHRTGRLPLSLRAIPLLVAIAAAVGVVLLSSPPGQPILSLPVRRGLRFDGGLALPPELVAAIIGIALFGGSYIAEIVRSGLSAVPKGQSEAGASLGLTGWQIFWKIRAPIAIRIILPTMTNQTIWLMKATTIGIAIGFTDFFAIVSVSITQAGQTLSLILILVLGFWAINLTISAVMNGINRAVAIPGRQLR